MALPPSASTEARALDAESVIENEIPTYRAVSPLALTSAGLGVVSALSFTDPIWLLASLLAVLTGVWAELRIRGRSDVLTGRTYAQAGIALGIMFAASSLGYSFWSNRAVRIEARGFGKLLEATLNESKATTPVDTVDVLWYTIPAPSRKGITPEEARGKIQEMTTGSEKYRDIDGRLRKMFKRAGDEKIALVEVESAFFQELDPFATILFRVGSGAGVDRGPGEAHEHDHDHAPGEDDHVGEGYALIRVKAQQDGGKYKWWLDELIYPYTPKTYQHVAIPKDDGHGHAH